MEKPSDNKPQYILAENERLSSSMLWALQRDYFESRGIEAWSQGVVPHYLTSNTYIAQAYARVVFGFLRDCYGVAQNSQNFGPLKREQPLYIVELGAGSGRFAYHFLKKFQEIVSLSNFKELHYTYVLTDLAGRNLQFWRSHERLQPLLEAGQLDFARFDATTDSELKLEHSGLTLTFETLKNPLVILANYFFDGIPQDAFYIGDGILYESLVSLASSQPAIAKDDPEPFQKLKIAFRGRPAKAAYYGDPDLDAILQTYLQQLSDTHILFPCEGIRCLRRLNQLANGRMLLLTGDKGYSKLDELNNRPMTGLNAHGSFSMMVNYHAIGQFLLNQNGQFLNTAHATGFLNICAGLLGQHPNVYSETKLAFEEFIEKGSPDDFYLMVTVLVKHDTTLDLSEFLAFLRLSGWDSKVFLDYLPRLVEQVEGRAEPLLKELQRELERVWDNYYPIGEPTDLPFHIAALLGNMRQFEKSLIYLQHSLRLYGPHPLTYSNLGICYYELGDTPQALVYINQALELDPINEMALNLLAQLQSEEASNKSSQL